MGLFGKKKEEETPERTPVKKLDRSAYVMTNKTKTSKTKSKKGDEKEMAEKKATTEKKTVKKAEAKPVAEKKTVKAAPAEKKEPAKKAAPKEKPKVWHITKREDVDKWQVKAEGNEKATKLFRTKAEAEEFVKKMKSNNEGSRVVAHKMDGKFQKK